MEHARSRDNIFCRYTFGIRLGAFADLEVDEPATLDGFFRRVGFRRKGI